MDQQSQQPSQSAPPPPPVAPAAAPVPTGWKKSSNVPMLLGILIASVVLLMGIVIYSKSAISGQNTSITQYGNPSSAPSEADAAGTMMSGDSQLDQQSKAIDSDMSTLKTDISKADQGLQDKSVDLSQ